MDVIHAVIKNGQIVPDEPLPPEATEVWLDLVDPADEGAWRRILDDPTPSAKLSALADEALRDLEQVL